MGDTMTDSELPQVERRSFTTLPDDAQADALMNRLRAQTTRPNRRAQRPALYNAPDLWYTHPTTGEVVKLQGDPASQAYYRSKGFHILTAEETRQWETVVRPIVVAEQRKRAALITTMRRIAARHPGVEIGGDLDVTPTERLEKMLEQLQAMAGGTVKVVMGSFEDSEPEFEDEDDGRPRGGEVTVSGGDDLLRQKARGDAAVVQGRVRGPGGRFTGAGAEV
jgi:hypothetical protein